MAKSPGTRSRQRTESERTDEGGESRTLVTQSEYARHRRVSAERVRQWRVAGQLVTEGEGRALRVHVEASDRRLAKTRDPQQDMAMRRRASREADGDPPDEPGPDEESFDYWKTRREAANAQLAEAKLKEEAGRLIDRDKAVGAAYAMVSAFRAALFNVPAREAGHLAARCEIDEHEAREILDGIVRRYLDEQAEVASEMKALATARHRHDEHEDDIDEDADE